MLTILVQLFLAPVLNATTSDTPPDLDKLIRNGEATLKKARHDSLSWTVINRFPNGLIIRAKVVQHGTRKEMIFTYTTNGRDNPLCRLIESDDVWFVLQGRHAAKYKPFEADLPLPGGYMFLLGADLHFVTDDKQFRLAEFEGRNGDVLSFRLPMPKEKRLILEKSISALEQLIADHPQYSKRDEVLKKLKSAREMRKGLPLKVDQTTGLIVERNISEVSISFEDLTWLDQDPHASFVTPDHLEWEDHTQPLSNEDLNDCVMVFHDSLAQPGNKNANFDGFLLNLKNDELRRLPFAGMQSMPGCFLQDRTKVLVSGIGESGGFALTELNLQTGRNRTIESHVDNGGLAMFGELSPDGKQAAAIQMFGSGQILEFQIRLTTLKTGESRLIGKPARIGAPFSWLPDGNGFLLKRFDPSTDPNAIEPRIICRMGLDGKITDLRRGDWPILLRKRGKILYQNDESQLWYTCDLEGKNPQLFGNGFPKFAFPAVSPDEKRIIFAHSETGKLPQLMLFEFGKTNGVIVTTNKGITTTPVWR